MGDDIVARLRDEILDAMRWKADWFRSLPKGATTRIEPEFAEDISAVLEMAVNEIERLRERVAELEEIVAGRRAVL